jgi:1,4-dihydroxy-6-naphthoate synthase
MPTKNSDTESYPEQTSNSKLFSLGFSPCPNDTFMFDALVNGKINCEEIFFTPELNDIESLNQKAISGESEISKVSFGVYPLIKDHYEFLTAGAALGNGVGPLFISKRKMKNPLREIQTVAIPGKNTTAYMLFKIFYPELTHVREMIFSGIEDAVLNEQVDAGVIIHENRFTYQEKGLQKISDLGELWEKNMGHMIPLGGIVIKRIYPQAVKQKINYLVKQSVEYAFNHPESSYEYVKANGQELNDEVRKKHIELYVNKYSIDLGAEGKKAVEVFLEKAGMSVKEKNLFVS